MKVDRDVTKINKELLHEKIAEYRHKEIIATIIGLMGLLMQWLFFFRFFWYGFFVFLAGMGAGWYYKHERGKLMKQLESQSQHKSKL